MNWDDHRYFLAIARARSLTAAGRALGVFIIEIWYDSAAASGPASSFA
jgi:hypothetical protein